MKNPVAPKAEIAESFQFSTSAFSPPTVVAAEPAALPSLIETMRMETGGRIPLLCRHLGRLQTSCHRLGYPWPGEAPVKALLEARRNALDLGRMWRLRLLLDPDGRLSLQSSRLAPLIEPVTVMVVGPRAIGAANWLSHKTTHRPWYESVTTWLSEHSDVFDVLFWNEHGEMCEGSRCNLYMQAPNGQWLTPPLTSGALPGVQRQAILDAGLAVEAQLDRDDFLRAAAWRISNALRGWCDAVPYSASPRAQ